MFYRMRKRKAGLTAFSTKQGFTHAMYACRITLHSGANLVEETLRFLIRLYANGREIWRIMSEQVGSEACSGVVGCALLHGSRHSRFRAGEELTPYPKLGKLELNLYKTLNWRHLTG